ncbi:Mur ligase family protein [Chryseobacterium indoltheticum]|uniref:Mur ligase family protein n=1 Tax=Chryseobacterium indoltheticum TaxID=254 RepID=UPI003F493C0A
MPLSLLQINKAHKLRIFEVGISKPNEMENLENIFQPKIGLLTHIGTAHLANFKSEEDLIDEKIQLFKNSEVIIYNGDNTLVDKKLNDLYSSKKLISYGLSNSNQVYFKNNISKDENFVVNYFGRRYPSLFIKEMKRL